MSTTNRAFIKAYRHDAVPAGGEAPSVAAPSASAARVGGTSSTSGAARAAERTQSATGGLQTATERRPLSSYMTRTEAGRAQFAPKNAHDHRGDGARPVPDAAADAFRPGTTVASFHWPAVCRTLVQQSGPQLDHVVRVLQSRARAGNSLIGVLGMFARVGATTTAMCLAARATGSGQRVILADGNFRRPCIASLLEAEPTASWEEFLKHSAPLADAVIHATSDNFDVLALGKWSTKDPQPLVSGLQAAVTAGVLRHAYDLVLLDLGTFFDPASQPTVLELTSNLGVDAVVAVTGPEPADPRDVATIVEHLDRSGCELLGVIENRIAKPKAA